MIIACCFFILLVSTFFFLALALRIKFMSVVNVEGDKAAFHLIEKFHSVDSGYAGGHFYNEWKALTQRYKVIEEDRMEDLQTTFYSAQMSMKRVLIYLQT